MLGFVNFNDSPSLELPFLGYDWEQCEVYELSRLKKRHRYHRDAQFFNSPSDLRDMGIHNSLATAVHRELIKILSGNKRDQDNLFTKLDNYHIEVVGHSNGSLTIYPSILDNLEIPAPLELSYEMTPGVFNDGHHTSRKLICDIPSLSRSGNSQFSPPLQPKRVLPKFIKPSCAGEHARKYMSTRRSFDGLKLTLTVEFAMKLVDVSIGQILIDMMRCFTVGPCSCSRTSPTSEDPTECEDGTSNIRVRAIPMMQILSDVDSYVLPGESVDNTSKEPLVYMVETHAKNREAQLFALGFYSSLYLPVF